MDETALVRRHLYEQYAGLRLRDVRGRRRLRRQIALLADLLPPPGGDGGPAGVREPRRPRPPRSGPGVARRR